MSSRIAISGEIAAFPFFAPSVTEMPSGAIEGTEPVISVQSPGGLCSKALSSGQRFAPVSRLGPRVQLFDDHSNEPKKTLKPDESK
ncbi:MAG: hypothetical protein DMG15_00355 [Acidobacteria bacterium]|nr:MAG: hypothetical protein DMG15_00355 [Acidobacteriota bacterium]